jgi:hypothetical protein
VKKKTNFVIVVVSLIAFLIISYLLGTYILGSVSLVEIFLAGVVALLVYAGPFLVILFFVLIIIKG